MAVAGPVEEIDLVTAHRRRASALHLKASAGLWRRLRAVQMFRSSTPCIRIRMSAPSRIGCFGNLARLDVHQINSGIALAVRHVGDGVRRYDKPGVSTRSSPRVK